MQPALGLTVVVVEDEPLLSMLMEDLLDEIGCTVAATAATVAAGLSAVEHLAFDIAILDVHLGREEVWPITDHLIEKGKAFILASGDDRDMLQKRCPAATILAKPYELASLTRALEDATRHAAGPVKPDAASV